MVFWLHGTTCTFVVKSLLVCFAWLTCLSMCMLLQLHNIINPRRACLARVTVLGLSVCVCVCVCVCVSVYLYSRATGN